ncbi:uncharacterized protein LOC129322952 [Prosopis cineraria]|uniref:uncharacterized protein LOC129322952 n=1 Tax=Prosopis cineraria TaxID=364024 RepID=UPI0024108FDE|nr:uncharacterized protein LOC129322952 [Prosopis cineraria]
MRGVALLAAKRKFNQISKVKGSGSCGMMATSPHKKKANNEFSEEKPITKEDIDPVVTVSRPPPFPPVLGPLVALTLLETGFNGDADGKS